jgi:hypothetical protein
MPKGPGARCWPGIKPQDDKHMIGRTAAYDPETVSTLIVVLDQAFAALPPDERTQERKVKIASKILSAASAGERDPSRLRAAASPHI